VIYSESIDYAILDIIFDMFPHSCVQVFGNSEIWTSIEIDQGASKLEIFSHIRKEQGDEFSGSILSAYTHMKKLSPANESFDKEELLNSILRTEWKVGIVSIPGFENTEHENIIMAIVKRLKGVIFDGNGVLDTDGDLILGV
jgi:hypothetical protein